MGPVLSTFAWPSNAELIEDVARLGYLDGRVADVTFGVGVFWRKFRPEVLVTSDIIKTGDLIADFTNLPFGDSTFDSVVFDPPYKFCVDDQTEILTRRGWLRWDQVQVGDFAYSINPRTSHGEWRRIDKVNIFHSPTTVLWHNGRNINFVATPHHRWFVKTRKGIWRFKTTVELSGYYRIPQSAAWADTPKEATISDEMVELIAWFWTEGSTDDAPRSTYGHITQSHVVNPKNCERIAACFNSLYGPPVAKFQRTGRSSDLTWRIKDEERNRRFIFSASIGRELLVYAPKKAPSVPFLEALTARQRALFISTSIKADGYRNVLAQRNPDAAESFALAAILSGYAVSFLDDDNGRRVLLKVRSFSKARKPMGGSGAKVVSMVWCPTIEQNGTWLARRKGHIFFTGNSGTPSAPDARYGIIKSERWRDRLALMQLGLAECIRVSRRYILAKAMDQVCSGAKRWQTDMLTDTAWFLGCDKVDRFDMLTTPRPQPGGRKQVHSLGNASQLLVFKKG